MAAPKRSTHVVEHPKLYMAVEGSLQHVKKGTELVLSDSVAENLGAKIRVLGEEKAVDMTKSENDLSKMKVDELKAKLTEANIEFADTAKKADLIKLLTAE